MDDHSDRLVNTRAFYGDFGSDVNPSRTAAKHTRLCAVFDIVILTAMAKLCFDVEDVLPI